MDGVDECMNEPVNQLHASYSHKRKPSVDGQMWVKQKTGLPNWMSSDVPRQLIGQLCQTRHDAI